MPGLKDIFSLFDCGPFSGPTFLSSQHQTNHMSYSNNSFSTPAAPRSLCHLCLSPIFRARAFALLGLSLLASLLMLDASAAPRVVSWGSSDTPLAQTNTPPDLTNVIAIATGYSHALALNRDHSI